MDQAFNRKTFLAGESEAGIAGGPRTCTVLTGWMTK